MKKFTIVSQGYDKDEVNSFLDELIVRFEKMIKEINEKNDMISTLRMDLSKNGFSPELERENKNLKDKVEQYKAMEETLNKAILMAQKTSDQMRLTAHNEAEVITTEARSNANRIVNDALMKADKVQVEADTLRRNLIVFKRRLRSVIETQLDLVDDIEKIEL